jgi:hypothetical protein
VLDLYAESPGPERPVVCFDESPVQLIGECVSRSRPNLASSNATIANTAATAPSISSSSSTCIGLAARSPSGARQKTTPMHARARRCPLSRCRVHPRRIICRPTWPALYQAFPPAEAKRILRRLEFHCTLASAWTAESTIQSSSSTKSTLGNDSEMPPAPDKAGTKRAARIRKRPKSLKRLKIASRRERTKSSLYDRRPKAIRLGFRSFATRSVGTGQMAISYRFLDKRFFRPSRASVGIQHNRGWFGHLWRHRSFHPMPECMTSAIFFGSSEPPFSAACLSTWTAA